MFPFGVLGLYLPHDLFEVHWYTRYFMDNGIPGFQKFSHTCSLLFFSRHLDLYFHRFAFELGVWWETLDPGCSLPFFWNSGKSEECC